MLQSSNCASVLRFLRPQRYHRIVWVDALCIGQMNLQERAAQVAKMRTIYTKCTRVIEYLGEDLVTRSKPFPTYRTLDELSRYREESIFPNGHPHHGKAFGMRELLERKLFARIRIVQELLLAERIVLRTGDVDYRVDARIMAQFVTRGFDWQHTAMPWARNMALRSLADSAGANIYSLLKTFHQSQCLDPRDKLFGTIALLRDDELNAPDYSLSYRHFCIGIFSDWMINRKMINLLHLTATVDSLECGLPSWLPDYESSSFWNLLATPSSSCPYAFARNDREDHLRSIFEDIRRIEEASSPIYTFGSRLGSRRSNNWSQESYVDANTDSLVLKMVHLHCFDEYPRFLQIHESAGHLFMFANTFSMQHPQQDALYLTSILRLDEVIHPHEDHLFMIDGEAIGVLESNNG